MTLLHQWTNTSVLQRKPLSTLIPCLKHRESTAPATKPESKSRTCAATPSSHLGRARVLMLQVKPLLISQVFPRSTSLGASHTHLRIQKGFLSQSNNPFWGPAVEMPAGRKAHLLCLRSVFLARMCCIFSANLYS